MFSSATATRATFSFRRRLNRDEMRCHQSYQPRLCSMHKWHAGDRRVRNDFAAVVFNKPPMQQESTQRRAAAAVAAVVCVGASNHLFLWLGDDNWRRPQRFVATQRPQRFVATQRGDHARPPVRAQGFIGVARHRQEIVGALCFLHARRKQEKSKAVLRISNATMPTRARIYGRQSRQIHQSFAQGWSAGGPRL